MRGGPHLPLGREATRIADEQLVRAMSDLHRAGAPADAVHDARRHIRKVRALLRLLRPRFSDETYAEATRRLRAVNRRLAEADAASTALQTLARVMERPEAHEACRALDAIRTALEQRADRIAASTHMLSRVTTTLAVERARIGTWDIEKQNLRIASVLETSRRRAANAMTRALERPTARRERAWRRCTTALWLHIRLLEPYRPELRPVRRTLESLDACLDESHNVRVLERILMTEALASRRDTSTALRLLRHYHTELRARAAVQGQSALRGQGRAQARAAVAISPARTTI